MEGMTDRRGQMLLIGGVLLAVAIIALAVVFNSAVFTSVLAGESYEDISSREPLGFQQEVRDIVGSVIERAVEEENSISAQERYVKNNLTALESTFQRYQTDSDAVVHTSFDSIIDGEFIYNSTGSSFVNESGNNTWDVGTDVRVRNFSLAVTGTSGSEPFTINVSGDSGDKYQIVVKSSEITVDGEDCSWSGSDLNLNVTESTIDGDRCNALDFFERLDEPYDIEFHNSKNASGRYSLLVTDAADDVASQDQKDRLYGATVDLEYHGPKIDWETTVRVAPGEPT